MAIRFYDTETESAASITYPDSKTELSFLKETKALLISCFGEANSDVPNKQISLPLVEIQVLYKLFKSSPDILSELTESELTE